MRINATENDKTIQYINLGDGEGNRPIDAVNNSFVSSVGSNAYYGTATHFINNNGFLGAYRTDISNNQTTVTYNANPACGNAVRLVRTVE